MMVQAVFHIDESAKWQLLMKNVRNLIREVDAQSSRIEVVANAGAVEFYLKKNQNGMETAQKLAGEGVRFVACRNALNELGIAQDELFSFVETVPSGVAELIARQQKGFAYIKP